MGRPSDEESNPEEVETEKKLTDDPQETEEGDVEDQSSVAGEDKENEPELIKKKKPNRLSSQQSKRRRRRWSSGSVSTASTAAPVISNERFKQLKDLVDKAAQHQKTFTILGRYPSIRDALKARGWVQNFDLQKLMTPRHRQFDDDEVILARLQSTDETERQVISRLLRHTPVSFLWATSENIDWNSLSKNTLVSRFPRVYFTTKIGICNYLQQSHWFCESGISVTKFPRCYNISNSDDLDAFIKDFRITACLGLLKKLVSLINSNGEVFHESGKIPLKTVEFAAKRCWELVAREEHEDIDRDTEERIWDHQWDQFLTHYYQFVHHEQKFSPATTAQIHEMYSCSKSALESVAPLWPQIEMDGTNDLWIVKPGAKSRGRGILVFNKLEDIVSRVSTFNSNEIRFVVQKYIERPLLIYNTKFDIRQWFLVTSVYPLTIWMYKESYLRFCSQLFSLTNMHESIHLSNNAIQCNYKNTPKRDKALPDENMWDCYTFKTYLRTLGLVDRWDTVVYSGMRESITGALLAAQEHMEHRRNCFELYGADFMLTEDLVPWLIEINSSPCMSPTTSVTARMCAQCLEDVIKVVIDKRNDKDADTGMFELAFRQQVSNPQPYMGMNLTVKGNRMNRSRGGRRSSAEMVRDMGSAAVRDTLKKLSDELKSNSTDSETDAVSPEPAKVPPRVFSSPGLNPSFDPKKRTYRKHCCVRNTTISQTVARYKSRNYEEMARRIRLSSNAMHFKTVQLPQATELFDWKKRVDQTRANCKKMFLKLTDQNKSPLKEECFEKNCDSLHLPEINKSKGEINNNSG